MRLSLSSPLLAGCAAAVVVSAAVIPRNETLAPALPLSDFAATSSKPLTLEEALEGGESENAPSFRVNEEFAAAATCTNPRIRVEWDSYSTADRTAYINAIRCLIGRPASGQFAQAKNRYEDLVALHQTLTENVHGNSKFLIWHRYYLWAFEDILRTECGFAGAIPWFDETKYSGRFSQSSIFSSDWYGAIALGGNCVTNGVSDSYYMSLLFSSRVVTIHIP